MAGGSSSTINFAGPGGAANLAGDDVPQLQKIVRRVQKEVQLTDAGNFVIDVPVSKHLLDGMPYTTGEEFTHLR
jgi:hypothetical protein